MAITIDTVTSKAVTTAASSDSLSHTVASGASLFVEVSCGSITVGQPTGVTYNGVAMTKVVEKSGLDNFSSIWFLSAPATGANNIAVTFSGNAYFCYGGISVLPSSGRRIAIGAINSGGGSGGSFSDVDCTLTTTYNNSLVLASIATNGQVLSGGTPGTGDVLQWGRNNSGNNSAGAAVSTVTTTAGAQTTSLTFTATTDERAWSIVEIVDASLTDGLITYLKLDESSGDAADSSGNGKTFTNNNTTAFATGKINNGADLERGSSHNFSRTNDVYDVTNGSISCWVKFETAGASNSDSILFTQTSGAGGFYFTRLRTSSKITLGFGAGAQQTEGTTSISTGEVGTWYYVTCTWSTLNKKIYVNGVLETTNSNAETMTAGLATIYLGRDPADPNYYFDGIIDELGVWNRQLSDREITELYNTGAGVSYPFTSANANFFAFM